MAKLSKSANTLIIAAGVLVLLGAVLAVLLITSPKEAEEVSSDASEDIQSSVEITDRKADNVVKLTVKNEFGTYSFDRAQRTVSTTDEEGNTTESTENFWKSGELLDVPQDDTKVLNFISGLAAFSAEKTVEENPDNLEQYGLSEPSAEAEVEFDDGTRASFYFGIKNPADDSDIYLRVNDSNTVLLGSYSAVEKVFCDVKEFANLLLTESYTDGENNLEYLKIERGDFEEPVEIEYMSELDTAEDNEDLTVTTSNTHRFVSPITAELDYTNGRTLWYNLYGLTADSLAYCEQSEENMAACGLSEPSAKVTFSYGGEERTLLFGSEIEDKSGYYFTLSTVPGIYTVSKETAVWCSFEIGNVISRRPLSPYIYSVDTIEITTPDGVFSFAVDNVQETFTCNGKSIDSDEFKTFYRMLIGTIGEEYYNGEVSSDTPKVTVKFSYRSEYFDIYGRESDTLEFYESGDRKDAVKLNGDTLYKVSEIYTERLIDNVNVLLEGGEVNIDW